MNKKRFEELEYNSQEREAQQPSWAQPAPVRTVPVNTKKQKKSFISKLVTFILTFKRGN